MKNQNKVAQKEVNRRMVNAHNLRRARAGIFAMVLFFLGVSVRADITNNLVLHLAFDETNGTTAVDTGSAGHNGILSNFVNDDTQWTNARIAGGLLFNPDFAGNDQVTVDGTGPLDFSGIDNPTFTLSAWVRGPVGGIQTNGAGIIAHGYGRGGEQYALDLFANSFRFFIRDSNSNAFTIQQAAGPTNISDGSWQMITGVYDGSLVTNALKLYINGQLIGQANGPTNALKRVLVAPHDLTVGIREDSVTSGYNNPFTGLIDDVRIYNRVLSAGDVLELYQVAAAVAPVILVQPPGGTHFVGETASISIVADGTFPITYRWYKDSVLISNAISSVLTLTNLQSSNSGTYFATASNSLNIATSSNAVLVVTVLATNDFNTALIAWWKFNETTGTTAHDSTTNNNTATLYQFPTDDSQWLTNAPLGGALRFNVAGGDANGDKNDYVWTDAPVPQPFSANFYTFAFWARADSLTDVGTNPRLITPGVNTGTGIPTVWELWRRSGATGGGAGMGPNNPQTSAAIDLTWKHFVITHDITAGAYNLYINGALVKSVASGYTRVSPAAFRWVIGHQENLLPAGDADFMRGEFSDFRMYNRLLTASQVNALYTNTPSYLLIDLQPQSATTLERGQVILTTVGDSTATPITYQWRRNGTPIAGATSSAFTLNYATTNDAGNYSAVISNAVGASVITATAVVTVNPLPGANVIDDMIAHWPFDETNSATTADTSGNNNSATLYNFPDNTSQWVPGVMGNALRFSITNEFVATDNGITFTNNNDFTFTFWAKADPGTQGSNPRLISPATLHWVLWRPTATAGVGNPAGVGLYMPATSAQPVTNAWTHYVCVVNRPANLYTLYVNGVRVVVNAIPTGQGVKPVPSSFVQWIIGHSENTTSHGDSFRGALDDMRIYNRAFNLNDVETLYEAGNVPPALSVGLSGTNLTLSWPSWAADYVPQMTTAVMPSGTSWTDVAGTPLLSGANRSVTVGVGSGASYYRLKK